MFVLCFCQGLFVSCQFMVTNSLFSFTPNLLSLFPLQTLQSLSSEPSFTFFPLSLQNLHFSSSLPKPSFLSFSLSLLSPSSFRFPCTFLIYPKLLSPFLYTYLLIFSLENLLSIFHTHIHYLSSFFFLKPSFISIKSYTSHSLTLLISSTSPPPSLPSIFCHAL